MQVVALNRRVRGWVLAKLSEGPLGAASLYFLRFDTHTIVGSTQPSISPVNRPSPAALLPHHSQALLHRQQPVL
jgi:hypothetical protein